MLASLGGRSVGVKIGGVNFRVFLFFLVLCNRNIFIPMRLAAGGRRQWSAAVGKSGCRRLSTSEGEGGQAGGKQSAGTSQYSTDTQPGGGMKILGRMA